MSSRKAMSEILLLLEKKDMILTEVAGHFNSILSALSRQPEDADLITEKKEAKNRFYSLNRKKTLELVENFEGMYKYNLKSLKEYIENKERKRI
jgi:ArsR family transcriptional regulator, arsenate/arsenite/antimonite-responsive transcriptional repressor